MTKLSRYTVLILGAWLATACSGVLTSDRPVRQEYLLQPLSANAPAVAPVERPELQLQVSAVPGLDTDRILALEPDSRLVQYANARWPDHLPEVLESVIRRSLTAAGGASDEDRSVALEVQEFFGVRDSEGATRTVAVSFSSVAQCGDSRQTTRLEASTPVSGDRLADVVAAHQAGLNEVTRQLIQQVNTSCE